jgi:hypothetical protein
LILFFKNIARKSGTKIKIITEPKTVSNGISILLNPKRIFDNNGKAKINIRSLIATCIKVNKGSPLARLLQTKTIAVHGAIPNRIIPETYSLASTGSIKLPYKKYKKETAMIAIETGFINQLIKRTIENPLILYFKFIIDLKSIDNIIGKIIPQIRIAIGRFILESSNLPIN